MENAFTVHGKAGAFPHPANAVSHSSMIQPVIHIPTAPTTANIHPFFPRRIGAYLRKMAIDGYIIQVDTRDIKEMNKLLSAIGRNINQIAKRVNAGGPTYQADMEEIRERLDQIWQLQRRILLSQR